MCRLGLNLYIDLYVCVCTLTVNARCAGAVDRRAQAAEAPRRGGTDAFIHGRGVRSDPRAGRNARLKRCITQTRATYGGLCGMPACGQAMGCDVCDTPELWRGAAGLCARVRTCAGAAESLHTYTDVYSLAAIADAVCPPRRRQDTIELSSIDTHCAINRRCSPSQRRSSRGHSNWAKRSLEQMNIL